MAIIMWNRQRYSFPLSPGLLQTSHPLKETPLPGVPPRPNYSSRSPPCPRTKTSARMVIPSQLRL